MRIAVIDVDAQAPVLVAVREGVAVDDGLCERFEGRRLLRGPACVRKGDSEYGAFYSLASFRVHDLEEVKQLFHERLGVRDCRPEPLYCAKKQLRLAPCLRQLHLCPTLDIGRVMPDTILVETHEYLQGVQLSSDHERVRRPPTRWFAFSNRKADSSTKTIEDGERRSSCHAKRVSE